MLLSIRNCESISCQTMAIGPAMDTDMWHSVHRIYCLMRCPGSNHLVMFIVFVKGSLNLVTGSVVIGNQIDPEQDDYPQDHAAGGPGAGQDPLGSVIQEQHAEQRPQTPQETDA